MAQPDPVAKLPGDPSLPSSSEELQKLIDAGTTKSKYSVEDFFKTPDKSSYQLSPDGQYFSYMGPYERRRNIFIQKIGEEKAIRITSETDRDIGGYFWANNDRLIFIKDSGGDENFSLFGVDKDGKNAKDLTPFEKVRIEIIDNLEDVDDAMIIGMNKNNPMLFDPYRININTGEVQQLAKNDNPAEPISTWMTDHDGKLRIAVKVKDGINQTVMYRANEKDEFKEVLTTNFRETMSPIFFDFDNGSVVYAASNLGRDKSVIVKFDMETGKEVGDPIFESDEVDVENIFYSKKRKVPTGITYTTWKRQYYFLDKERERTQQILEGKLPNQEVVVTGMSKDEDKMMIRTYSDRSLGAYYFYDTKTEKLEKITDVSPWINPEDMAEMKPVKYKTRDGIEINGYLTLPKGKEAKNLPVIVNPHGGPWARDSWTYNPEIQLLASRGYAVFQMNFRGSVGYGRKFWEMSFKEWGRKMQDDITDGAKWLVKEGIADEKRIAIYGGSYGGYATLAGITKTPDLYACAIDYVGVSNLFTFMETIPPYWKPYLEMLYEMVGHPEKDKDAMTANSPAFLVDKIKCPLFVVQGANDPRVNIDEADQIVRSLRERKIDVPYMVKYNEGHGFHNEENQFEFYKAMLGFFATHL